MFDGHPEGQCRLDTYLAGAVCPVSWMESLSKKDPNHGSCNRDQGFTTGLRPLCWFKPPSDDEDHSETR